MDVSQLPDALERSVPTIVCVQAGEVNTGAFDDIEAAIEAASGTDAWVHVDGAFGLWAATYRRSGISSPATSAPIPGRRTHTNG